MEIPLDPASLVLFRVIFGLLNLLSVLRFASKGWIEEIYIRPTFHFSYWGFEWIRPWPGVGMYWHFGVLGLASLGIMLGCYYRLSVIIFFLAFTSLELMEKATYLNHYYFISLVSFLMIFMPLGRVGSVDVWRTPEWRLEQLPGWVVWTLRVQLGLVYFFAGLAKLKADWLLEAQPLRTWLLARSEFPVLGPLFTQSWVAYMMSWAGMFFDITVFFCLLRRQTRVLAYAAVFGFHLLTGLLFQIGMFPWIMMGLTLLFFDADWPRHIPIFGRWIQRWLPSSPEREAGWNSTSVPSVSGL
ncbi:MAG: HTTM domain-containing protein, partial [Myxococcota bacterium]